MSPGLSLRLRSCFHPGFACHSLEQPPGSSFGSQVSLFPEPIHESIVSNLSVSIRNHWYKQQKANISNISIKKKGILEGWQGAHRMGGRAD